MGRRSFARAMVPAAAAALLLLAAPCPAPVFGCWPGTEWMMEQADAIVIAEVGELCVPEEARCGEPREDGWAWGRNPSPVFRELYDCRIVCTLKGPLDKGDAVMELRWLPQAPGFVEPLWVRAFRGPDTPQPHMKGTYLIFVMGEPRVASANYEGSVVPVPDGFLPEDVHGMSPEEAVHSITGDVAEATEFNVMPTRKDARLREQRLQYAWSAWRNVCDAPGGFEPVRRR